MAKISGNKLFSLLAAAGLSIAGVIGGAMLVAPHEGFVPGGYVDPVGVVTACYGHTGSDVSIGDEYTNAQCVSMLAKDVQAADASVLATIHAPLTWYQEAALISFTYNVGEDNLRKSSVARLFNEGKYREGCEAMKMWVYAKGKKLPGLVNRREQEAQVCLGNVTGLGVQ